MRFAFYGYSFIYEGKGENEMYALCREIEGEKNMERDRTARRTEIIQRQERDRDGEIESESKKE